MADTPVHNLTEKKIADESSTLRLFTIAPGAPFLRTLADRLICGQLIKGFCPKDDPFLLSQCTLYLPTRRAARALGLELAECMAEHTGADAIILPRIRTMGDLDEDEQLDDIAGFGSEIPAMLDDLANVIDPVERHLTLARLTRSWIGSMTPQTRNLFAEEHIVLPSSAADALRLASDLADFMDQVETEEADWADIAAAADKDHAQWWEVTLRFLDIVMRAWPAYLKERNRINPAAFRKLVSDHRISKLLEHPPDGPVIAAGSTGSIPSTARLLKCIAGMEKGAVVLPGLDLELPEAIARRFARDGELSLETALSTHPQYAMLNLLSSMKAGHGDVREAGKVTAGQELRGQVLNICLRPAEDTGDWMNVRHGMDDKKLHDAFLPVHLVEAPGERVEALSIALILRETLEQDGKTAALVTPDRQLARRVAVELERFGIKIDDSAGGPLLNSAAALELRQLLRVVFDEADPVAWCGFLNSHLARRLAGSNDHEKDRPLLDSRFAELMELAIVRDCLQLPNPAKLAEAVAAARSRIADTSHAHKTLKALQDDDWQALEEIAGRLRRNLSPLLKLAERSRPLSLQVLADALLEILGTKPETDIASPAEKQGREELLALLQSHCVQFGTGFEFQYDDTIAVFDALLAPAITRSSKRSHPRLQIFGTLEARLQHFDRVILGGLNEGIWPPSSRNDPFLNRPMRSNLGLPLPERRIGLAAHDFIQLSGASEVFYTRSKRQGDAPSIASRWLQRIETFLGSNLHAGMRLRGDRYLQLAGMIDEPEGEPAEISRTLATPPVEARPTKLSITEIETWIRDPYAIYAKHVLGLHALPDIVRLADPALRGTLYHAVFAEFIKAWRGPITPDAEAMLHGIADHCFADAALPAEINAIWRPRFDEIAQGFLQWESGRRDMIAASQCEVRGEAQIGETGFTLSGRADRIDIGHNGELFVLDYKTGLKPSASQARTLSPQLALEGALAMRGAFRGVAGGELAALHYIRLREGEQFRADDITRDRKQELASPGTLADKAYRQLSELITAYQNPAQGYVSRYAPEKESEFLGNYNHLARVREWSISEEGDGFEEGGEE